MYLFQFTSVLGVIKDGKVFSDCLYPDFIDTLNGAFKLQFMYDENGIGNLCNFLRNEYEGNETYKVFINDIENWLKNAI